MKKITKKILNAAVISTIGVVGFGSLSMTLVSCKQNNNDVPPTPPSPPMPSVKNLSPLLFNKTTNQINLIKPYTKPDNSIINAPKVDKDGKSIFVTTDYIKTLPEYKNKINLVNEDKNIFKNYLIGLTNDFINKTITELKIPKNVVIANVKSDFDKKTCDIVVQFTNETSKVIQNSEVTLQPDEYFAKSISLDFSNIHFDFDKSNKLIVDGAKIEGQTDINGNITKWDKIDENYQINNKTDLLNTNVANVSKETTSENEIEKWKEKNFNSNELSQQILADIEKTIQAKVNLTQTILDNVQPIADLLISNVSIKDFLNGIGSHIAGILNLFETTKPFSKLIGDILSPNGTGQLITEDINSLVEDKKLPEIVNTIIPSIVDQMGDKTFVEWLLSLDYNLIHDTIAAFGSALPPQIKNIVDILDTYLSLVYKLSSSGLIADLSVLSVIADKSITEQIPSLLEKIKVILPSEQQKIIGIIITLWKEIQPNWNVENIKTLLSDIFNPYIGENNTTTSTKLNEALRQTLFITTPTGTINFNETNKTFDVNQLVQIKFNDELKFKLTGLKALLNNVKISTIIEATGATIPVPGWLIDFIGTIGALLNDTFDIKKDEGLDVIFKDQNATVRPTQYGYELVANQYIKINLSKTFQSFIDNNKFASSIKLFAKSYINAIKNYYFGFNYAINSTFPINKPDIGLNLTNVFNGKNKFNADESKINELKTTIIPTYIKEKLSSITDKREWIIEADQTLKDQIVNALNIDSTYYNNFHIQIHLLPTFDTKATSQVNPVVANAWINIEFDQPFLNATNEKEYYWTNIFTLSNFDLSIINTPTNTY